MPLSIPKKIIAAVQTDGSYIGPLFCIFASVLVILYFFFGTSFEIRVFAELLPMVAIIAAS